MRGSSAARPPAPDPLGPELRRLRRRLTGVFAVAATSVVVLFVLALVRTSTVGERRRLDADLAGAASRATALIWDDDAGRTQVDGIVNDVLTSSGTPLLVTETRPGPVDRVLLAERVPDRTDALALARRAAGGGTDAAIYGTVHLGEEPLRAAAMPWIHDDDRIGGAVVVVARAPVTFASSGLALPAVAGGICVLAVVVALAWVVATRSLRPAAQALADRERFLSTAAHELRGPLARLRAGAEAARRSVRPGDPAADAVGQLVNVADGAARVVSNLLLATRTGQGPVETRRDPVDLATLVGDLELSRPTVLVDVVEPVPVRGDGPLLRHALDNLVDNALRYGRVGGALPTVDVRVRREGAAAVVTVTDDGPGFPPDVDVLARHVTGPGGGTGLGLPLVRWIVEQHAGALRVGDAPPASGGNGQRHGGAIVEIRLPLDESGAGL